MLHKGISTKELKLHWNFVIPISVKLPKVTAVTKEN